MTAVAFTFAGLPAGFVIAGDLLQGAGFHEDSRSTLDVKLGGQLVDRPARRWNDAWAVAGC
jgi:hypothetical protein